MSRTRKPKSGPPPQPERPPAAVNGAPGEVLTLAEAAAYLRLSEANVIAAVHSEGLPGRLVGGEWRFFRNAIQLWLSTGSPTSETRKAAQLALAGKYKDDTHLEQIVEDAMHRRGRPLLEDGTYSGRDRG
jgi:excisionase family DNA binding protein